MYTNMQWWKDIRFEILREGVPKQEVLKREGIHRDTLQKILTHSEPPGYRMKKARPKPKIGPYLDRIEQIIKEDKAVPKKQRHTAKRIYARLQEMGYQGTHSPTNFFRAKPRTSVTGTD